MVWNLNSYEYGKLVRSYNTAVKLIWDLPHQTHKMFVEEFTNCPHLQSMLHSRYIGFLKSLEFSKKMEVKILFNHCKNDVSTLTGSNIVYLETKYECHSLANLYDNKNHVSTARVNPIEENDRWKPLILEDLIEVRDGNAEVDLTPDEILDLINFVSTS